MRQDSRKTINKYKIIIYILLIGIVLVFCSKFQITRVSGQSMEPTLRNRQIVLVEKCKEKYETNNIITFTTKTKIGGTDYGGTWTILRGLPRIDSNEKKAIHDTTEKYAFFMGSVNNDIYTDSLRIFSEEYGYIPANTTVTVQFKY